jgi:hypothetical protein
VLMGGLGVGLVRLGGGEVRCVYVHVLVNGNRWLFYGIPRILISWGGLGVS